MRHKNLIMFGCAAFVLALSVAPLEAQRNRRGGGGHVTVIRHSPLLWGGGFYPAYYRPYYFGFGQWYPYPNPVFGYPPGIFHGGDGAVTLRLQVMPRDAAVFVDGYAAGVVDDYDGVFQRLRLVPGPHEIVIYHPSYRTLRQNIYYNPGSSHTIRQTLDLLQAGDIAEPQPVPRAMPAYPGMPPGAPGMPPADFGRAPEAGRLAEGTRVGTLTLRVQPGDATVLVDGEPWRGPQTQDRVVIQLAEGTHRVRVEKSGFQAFAVDVDVRAGETTSFNVSLLR
ncbi:MAG TPA: PEGA domain-containing protein [Vicinamibacterales bacterium]|nr:PEGA domain-containing protein [Vicinamibacterales bacterium]